MCSWGRPPLGPYDPDAAYNRSAAPADDVADPADAAASSSSSSEGGPCLHQLPDGVELGLGSPSGVGLRGGGGGGAPPRAAAARQVGAAARLLQRFQNAVARPMLARHGVGLVPLWHALSTRGEMHASSSTSMDCTHWCEQSEVTLHIAKAVLSVLADVGKDDSD